MRWPTTRSTSLAALLAGLALLGGCGDDGGQVTPTAPATVQTLTVTAGTTPAAGPPPLTVLTETGEAQMVAFGGCWNAPGETQICGDPEWPSCPSPGLPDIPAFPGDELTFVLPYPEVTTLELSTGDGTTPIDLDPAAKVDWNVVTPDGPIVLRAVIPGRGDPTWAACLLPMS